MFTGKPGTGNRLECKHYLHIRDKYGAPANVISPSSTGIDIICINNVAYYSYICVLFIQQTTCINIIDNNHSGTLFDLPQQYCVSSR